MTEDSLSDKPFAHQSHQAGYFRPSGQYCESLQVHQPINGGQQFTLSDNPVDSRVTIYTNSGAETATYHESAAQQKLAATYEALTEELTLEEHLKLLKGRAIPKNIDEYRLVTVTGPIEGYRANRNGEYARIIKPPVGTFCDYYEDGYFYADARLNIGLVYRDKLIAVAGAQALDESTVMVVQLQAVIDRPTAPPIGESKTEDKQRRKDRMKSGLHSGFYWRDTLVHIWEEVAREAGFNVLRLQSAANNTWRTSAEVEQLEQAYDTVALRLGMDMALDGKWSLELDSPADIKPFLGADFKDMLPPKAAALAILTNALLADSLSYEPQNPEKQLPKPTINL